MFSIRKMENKDLEIVLSWRNRDEIRLNMINDNIIKFEEHQKWFNRITNQKNVEFLIFSINNVPVGIVNFSNISSDCCDWGFYIGAEKTLKGSGSAMAYYAIEYIFKKYTLTKINSEVIEFNDASIYFHKSLGFEEDGLADFEIERFGNSHNVFKFHLEINDWNLRKNVIKEKIDKIEGVLNNASTFLGER